MGLACGFGLVLALLLGRTLAGMLYGIPPWDPATLAAVLLIVIVVAILSALVPAVRAARMDPMETLRKD